MTTLKSAGSVAGLRVTAAAGGGLVVRPGADGQIRVALIHRQREDEWSFPKGKCRRGEAMLTAALRAVRDEAGFLCVAEVQLGSTDHVDHRGRLIMVTYWAMNRVIGGFAASAAVDALQWLRPAEARLRLTCEQDRSLLASAVPVLTEIVRLREREVVSSG